MKKALENPMILGIQRGVLEAVCKGAFNFSRVLGHFMLQLYKCYQRMLLVVVQYIITTSEDPQNHSKSK